MTTTAPTLFGCAKTRKNAKKKRMQGVIDRIMKLSKGQTLGMSAVDMVREMREERMRSIMRCLPAAFPEEQTISPAWRGEVQERQAAYRAGTTKTVSAEEAHQRIEMRLAQLRVGK